jgi:hypothetical protein
MRSVVIWTRAAERRDETLLVRFVCPLLGMQNRCRSRQNSRSSIGGRVGFSSKDDAVWHPGAAVHAQ